MRKDEFDLPLPCACPSCGHLCKTVRDISGPSPSPSRPGAHLICRLCGGLSILLGDFTLRKATTEEEEDQSNAHFAFCLLKIRELIKKGEPLL